MDLQQRDHSTLRRLLGAARPTKRLVSVIYDSLALGASLYIAWALRLGQLDIAPTPIDLTCLAITVAISIFVFIRLGLYRAILRYMAQEAVVSIAIGLIISAVTLAASSFFLKGTIPRSVPIIYLLTASFLIGLPRLMVRNIVQMLYPIGDIKVLIYGAGSAGRMLADALRPSREFQVVGFLDDDPRLRDTRIRGLPVYPGEDAGALIAKHHCTKVFLALGAADRVAKLAIIRQMEKYPVQIQTIPPLLDLSRGDANIEEIRNIQIEELLGRDPVQPVPELMQANIHSKVVMVTGAGGSIGSELCRQIIKHAPQTLILFELNEYNLYNIEDELSHTPDRSANTELVAMLGSVQDQQRLEAVMKHFQVQTVYHAAAYKHVPLVEHNVIEGTRNNVFGTWHCALAARNTGVETFVLISTDKAVRSTNIMGASKRLAEIAIQLVSRDAPSTRFAIVRFGNVLGSSGSVVPRFRSQIQMGGPVTVTHPDITRYFMTIPEASQLVIQAGAMSQGGETFVLEMGEPVRIADLAAEMIRLSGYSVRDTENPHGDIEIIYSGLRPGEKLYEELLLSDNVVGTQHPRITQAREPEVDPEEFQEVLSSLRKSCEAQDFRSVADIIRNLNCVYEGNGFIVDNLAAPSDGPGRHPKLHVVTK
ncbi:nucleoside-diphosphate sugar epimerase/dehydratase [Pseudomaricurvus sp. HS19]|uniref:polysaccharide biosynthesis protein n=1 Tax=Pseudomaricurvus sp. HS19 TaxID=2692626 RepID=UPI00136D65C1|nr:nucleoside-diphosphate sugar epimerase/dehydratase [Pseudomaricurvus sp. HS19]MYM62852.1 polysaccharide biosynthesis protein [Pseudomaricurvus sp. HS19]